MKRSTISLVEIADWHNLAQAFSRAALGCGKSPAVEAFARDFDGNLVRLQEQILQQSLVLGDMRSFYIRDPKVRLIHAPCFRERVLHHALIAHIGPVLDRALVDDTYACRKGKGALLAVRRCQQHLQRFNYFVQIDIRGYFSNINQEILYELLRRKFKNAAVLALIKKIITAYQSTPGLGLPIGSLTSQHFANYYLTGLDRYLLETLKVRGMVRYMDDLLWCCDSKAQARKSLHLAQAFIQETLQLEVKQPPRIGRCRDGTLFCGYRVLPSRLLLSRRRKRRYIERRRFWESQYQQGKIDALTLQSGYSAALAITAHTDAASWRREQLRRQPLDNSLLEV